MTQNLEKILQNKPFVIAEVGSNWESYDDLLISVSEAKKAGAHAVKFQMFDWESLYGFHPEDKILTTNWLGRQTISYVKKQPLHGGITKDLVEPLWEKCRAMDIEFMCTAFSPEDAMFLDPYVNIHKVASSDLEYKELFEVLVKAKKPILFSTGGHSYNDIERVLTLLGSTPSVIMYCVSSYPAKTTQTENIKILKDRFHNFVGFSDHSIDIFDIPKLAVNHGAIVIEKHFKIRDMDTPDSPHSLNPKEFELMIKNLQDKHPLKLLTHEEKDMILKYNRRLICIDDMEPGDVFVNGINYGSYRSLEPCDGGITSWMYAEVAGKVCKKTLKKGDHVTIDAIML